MQLGHLGRAVGAPAVAGPQWFDEAVALVKPQGFGADAEPSSGFGRAEMNVLHCGLPIDRMTCEGGPWDKVKGRIRGRVLATNFPGPASLISFFRIRYIMGNFIPTLHLPYQILGVEFDC